MTLSGPSNDGPYWVILEGGKKGIQGEQVASPSLTPEGLTEGQAQEIVSGYCQGLWGLVEETDFEAAVAGEIEEMGAGRAVIAAATNARLKGSGK